MHAQALAAIIVVGWNSREDLSGCLGSLTAQDYSNFKIVFVDNASTDESVAFVKENFPEVIILAQAKNLYFTGGNNAGMRYALNTLKADYIALINPDTRCSANWLSSQIKVLEAKDDVGLVGCKVLFAPGFGTSKAKTTNEQQIINTAGLEPGGFLFPYDRGFGEVDKGQFDAGQEIYAASGVSMVTRAKALRTAGLFLEAMEMYLEDVELCLRIKEAGYKIWYTPEAQVWHKHMQSTGKQKNGFYLIRSHANYLVLVARHFPLKKLGRAFYVNWRKLTFIKFVQTSFRFLRIMLSSSIN
jgi:GT2 family glycosyltransferase